MIKRNQTFLNRVSALIDTLIAFASVMLAHLIRFALPSAVVSLPMHYYYYLAGAYAAAHLAVYLLTGFYRLIRLNRYYTVLTRILVNETLVMLTGLAGLYLLKLDDVSRGVLFIAYGINILLVGSKHMLTRLLRAYRRKGFNLKHVLLIGSGDTARQYEAITREHGEYGYHVIGYISGESDWEGLERLGGYGDIERVLDEKKPDETVIALPAEEYVNMISVIQACEHAGVHLHIVPCYDRYVASRVEADNLEGTNLIGIRHIPLDSLGLAALKRLTDLVVSVIALIVTSPLLLFSAAGIKLTSPGPVIFKQRRVGKDKKPFTMYKLRSMRLNDSSDRAWSKDEDARKTKFGAFLRKFSIDELPQFWNVIKGDMSVVGPRPEIPYFVDRFKNEIPLYMIKHYVKPGITGWAQVNGLRGDTSIKERVEHDVYYIENWTWLLDVKIMLMTALRIKNSEVVLPERNVRA